ncbi:PadR family transcriptional regulator [Picosynechococcus sp. PCC 73109]|uniref:PadR family transcriptional regulator n=1 Tax=Picosynechococcus sp. PCC 73109 TaxID=374982 RepID=UPI0009005712
MATCTNKKIRGPSLHYVYDFKHSYKLESILLRVLQPKELYGREIPDVVKKASRGHYEIRIGSLYPTLRKLERNGFVRAETRANPAFSGATDRRYYSLTEQGRDFLNQCLEFEQRLAEGIELSPEDRELSHAV